MLKRLCILGVSVVFSLLLLVVSINLYLKFSGKARSPHAVTWMLNGSTFSPSNIFWEKNWCENHNCSYAEEKYLASPIELYGTDVTEESKCIRLLFLGDSFTIAPWISGKKSYASKFSELFSEKSGNCVLLMRLAAGGASNSQEFNVFKNRIAQLQPDLVFWQFYWNDVAENAQFSIYLVRNNRLVQRMGWKNMLFISGVLNQKIPILRTTTLGKHLLYLGEQKDPLSFWEFDFRNPDYLYPFNSSLIPLLFKEMNALSDEYDFDWYTTLSPLECQYGGNFTNCSFKEQAQNYLRQTLMNNTNYISMEPQVDIRSNQAVAVNVETPLNNEYGRLFNQKEDKSDPGSKHLSEEGNQYFGAVLFDNYEKILKLQK